MGGNREVLKLFKSKERKDDMSEIGHNSGEVKEKIAKIVNEYVESLARSSEENDIRTDLRNKAEELGIDKKALQDSVTRAKQSLKKREGYDESMALIKEVVDGIGTENLFSWVLEKEERKQKEREERLADRKAQKKKDDEFKAAPDRDPGPVTSVDPEEETPLEKSIGEQQAEAVLSTM